MSTTRRTINEAMPYIQPMISERKAGMGEFGEDWSDKPVRSVVNTFVFLIGTKTTPRMICSNGSLTRRSLGATQT